MMLAARKDVPGALQRARAERPQAKRRRSSVCVQCPSQPLPARPIADPRPGGLTALGADLLVHLWPREGVVTGRGTCRLLRQVLDRAPGLSLRVSGRIATMEAGAWLGRLRASDMSVSLAADPSCRFWCLADDQEWRHKVTTLHIHDFPEAGGVLAGDRLGLFENLTDLSLSGVALGDGGARAVFAGMRCRGLTTLNLHRAGLGDKGVGHVADALARVGCALAHLNLGGNSFFGEGARKLAAALRVSDLKSLDLSRTVDQVLTDLRRNTYRENEGREFAEHVGRGLLPRCSALEDLNLSCRYVGEQGASDLALGIRACTRLASLSLTGNVWDGKGVEHLASVLPVCTQLTTFRLSGRPIEDGMPDCVSRGLGMLPRLQEVELSGVYSGCQVGGLFESLNNAMGLRSLALTGGGLGADGARRLAGLLTRCTQLTSLNLAGNAIDESGVGCLAAGLHSSVTALGLNKCCLGDEGAERLAAVVSARLPLLRSLHVRENGMTEHGILRVCEALGTRLQRLSAADNIRSQRSRESKKFKASLASLVPACDLSL
mmetsp:Transcript_14197/g.34726  ORF Transcript_14197/g.34726 Transcript_14197/m.34726 type:complete len:548 (-) Transcript_14197:17-1660(-)